MEVILSSEPIVRGASNKVTGGTGGPESQDLYKPFLQVDLRLVVIKLSLNGGVYGISPQ